MAAKPTISAFLQASLNAAHTRAKKGSYREVTAELLITSILRDDPDVRSLIRACDLRAAAVDTVLQKVTETLPRSWMMRFREPAVSSDSRTLLEGAAIRAISADLPQVTPMLVVVEFLLQQQKSFLAQELFELGMTTNRAVRYAAHGFVTPPPLRSSDADYCNVVIHNDPFSTMEFVTELFMDPLRLSRMDAEAATQHVHQEGMGEVGPFPCEEALALGQEIRDRADVVSSPLLVTLSDAPTAVQGDTVSTAP